MLYKFVKSPIRHLGLAIGIVQCVLLFSPTLPIPGGCFNIKMSSHYKDKMVPSYFIFKIQIDVPGNKIFIQHVQYKDAALAVKGFLITQDCPEPYGSLERTANWHLYNNGIFCLKCGTTT